MERPFAVYHAFSDIAFGGSRAALVDEAYGLDDLTMQQIAIEFAAPATGFISSVTDDRIEARFFSTQTEYPMCGHGSIALAGWLLDRGTIKLAGSDRQIKLVTPSSEATLHLTIDSSGLFLAQLALQPSAFESWKTDPREMLAALGLKSAELKADLPLGYTNTDFRHLIIAVDGLSVLQQVRPDMNRLESCCRMLGIDTVMLFCTQTEYPDAEIHCREFAPAVGANEVPATGTTNRALACFLHQYRVTEFATDGETLIQVEQGIEMGRPSRIQSRV